MQTQAADKILSDQTDVAYRLQIHSRKLINTWKRFSPELFSVEGEEFRTPSEYKLTLDTLRDTILQAERRREAKKRGWVKERFLNFIDMMDNHKYLLEFIPKGDKYVSLFTGVISSVVKVSFPNNNFDAPRSASRKSDSTVADGQRNGTGFVGTQKDFRNLFHGSSEHNHGAGTC